MQLCSVRFPIGVLLVCALAFASAAAQAVPSALITSATQRAETCTPQKPASFPIVELDCTHELEYVGEYSAAGVYEPLSPNRAWFNQQSLPNRFDDQGRPLARPLEVPAFVGMQSQERVIENYGGRTHAVKAIRAQSRLSTFFNGMVTLAYGHEKPILMPQYMAADFRGRLIVSDPQAGAVHVLDGASSFRILAGRNRRLRTISGVAVDRSDNIYIVDSERGLVNVYDPHGLFLRHIGQIDNESFFERPTAIAIHRGRNHIYLLDTPRNTMMILDLQGNILKRVGHRQTDKIPVNLLYPTEVAVSNEEVAVLDNNGSRIQVFDLNGNLTRQFDTGTSYGHGITSAESKMGVAIDNEGLIYLSNVRGAAVRVFSRDGKVLTSFGASGDAEGKFRNPTGIWVDDTRVFVADTLNRRIAVYRVKGVERESNDAVLLAGGQ